MYTSLTAWLVYLIGALALVAVVWRMTRSVRRDWHYLSVVSVAALLLTPAQIDSINNYWAPALLTLVLDLVFGSVTDESTGQSVLLLIIVWLLALMASLVFLLLTRGRASAPRAAADNT
ncbi:hypothetical protein [Marinimicrobium alkaliphilum]|uniref:hypothetical protein n=1 Tax=Marinimicrobium alkaliphilum TaxID=2202654 RepID=UPI000DBA28FB|nr:hypothetical protein [Marinimicrobium alkaliphilum]